MDCPSQHHLPVDIINHKINIKLTFAYHKIICINDMLQVIYTIKFMNEYTSYKQIFNQNEGLHNRRNNGKIIRYKRATLEGVIMK